MDAAASVPPAPVPGRTRSRLRTDLAILGIVGILLIAAIGAAGVTLYREYYSPSAFVERYLGMLTEGRAADALALPGVSVDSSELEAAGMPVTASDALLRRAALAPLTDIKILSEETKGDVTRVTVSYSAGNHPGKTTFDVEPNGWIGVAPAWRFATSPLAVIDLTIRGSMQFAVNTFEIDKRQVSMDGVDVDPLASAPFLVFSPGLYSVTVDTAISESPGVAVLSDSPLTSVDVDLQTVPTAKFIEVVQREVSDFLTACATQQVLQPTGCPFGFRVDDRIDSPPTWSIATQPTVVVEPNDENWKIPATDAVAHIEVDIRSLYDGSVRHVAEDIPFIVTGSITVLPDGTASISVTGPDTF